MVLCFGWRRTALYSTRIVPRLGQHKMAIVSHKYEEAVKTLNQLQCEKMLSSKEKYDGLGLIVMKQFLERVEITDNDINRMKIIHVAGTKGKGSTCAFVESILRQHEVSTGFFSSPHLVEVRERFRINGKPISYDMFANYFWRVYDLLDHSKQSYTVKMPSYFYFLTTMAFFVFKHENVEAVVMEVGIGGAFDCTNVIQHPIVCGITSLGIDHVKLLGSTIESIAWQKAGIFKKNVPAFTVEQPREAINVLESRASEIGTTLNVVPNLSQQWRKRNIHLGISGNYQKLNAALAVQLAYCWLNKGLLATPLSLDFSFIEGLEKCQWYGRAQIIKCNKVTFYLDGAHTKKSIACTANWFDHESAKEESELDGPCSRVLAFNVTGERQADKLLSLLFSCNFSHSIFSPNIAYLSSDFNDQTKLNHPVEDQLLQVFSHQDDWIKLCSQFGIQPSSAVFPTVADAVCCLLKDRDKNMYHHSSSVTADFVNAKNIFKFSAGHLQILVTGSLHLVGAYLRVLKPDINN